jgi:hypothetical protein
LGFDLGFLFKNGNLEILNVSFLSGKGVRRTILEWIIVGFLKVDIGIYSEKK